MTDEELQEIVARLDREIPKEGAAVKFVICGEPGESGVEANRLGYLRLGTEFLKAATAPLSADSDSLDTDLKYLVTDDSDNWLGWLQRRDELAPAGESASAWHKNVLAGSVAVFVFASLIVGGIVVLYFVYVVVVALLRMAVG